MCYLTSEVFGVGSALCENKNTPTLELDELIPMVLEIFAQIDVQTI